MSASDQLDRALERFAPDTAAAMRLTAMVDEAADRLVVSEAHRDAYDGDGDWDDIASDLDEAVHYADGKLHGLSDALGLLVGGDSLRIHTDALARAVERRAARVREFEELIGLCP